MCGELGCWVVWVGLGCRSCVVRLGWLRVRPQDLFIIFTYVGDAVERCFSFEGLAKPLSGEMQSDPKKGFSFAPLGTVVPPLPRAVELGAGMFVLSSCPLASPPLTPAENWET